MPERFQRIRHYGLLTNRGKRERLGRIRQLLGAKPPASSQQQPRTLADWLNSVMGIAPDRCPCCGETLLQETLEPQPLPTVVAGSDQLAPWDTS